MSGKLEWFNREVRLLSHINTTRDRIFRIFPVVWHVQNSTLSMTENTQPNSKGSNRLTAYSKLGGDN